MSSDAITTGGGKPPWKTIILFTVVAMAVVVLVWAEGGPNPQVSLAETRQALRQAGFKTDLADFDFSTSSEFRERADVLTAYDRPPPGSAMQPPVNLMTAVGTNTALVLWQEPQYESAQWSQMHDVMDGNLNELIEADKAVLAGPLRFQLDAKNGGGMLLAHLGALRSLEETCGDQMVLDLHEGILGDAWTNLLASTRLVTAWQVEPVAVSQLVRMNLTRLAFNTVWQALQTNGWTDDQLARLQQEWADAVFFTNLPETMAFQGACAVDLCERMRTDPGRPMFGIKESVEELERTHSIRLAWGQLNADRTEARYRRQGSYEDEKSLLLFYQQRELEIRRALQAQTWADMSSLPGVTNNPPFRSPYHSRFQAMLRMRNLSMSASQQQFGLLRAAAEAETWRRLAVTAIALERFHRLHGSYPDDLAGLPPDFVKVPPVDFMDGRPLRYHRTSDGHFFLYSVGLDGVDNAGNMNASEGSPMSGGSRMTAAGTLSFDRWTGFDQVWPAPAGAEAVAALHQSNLAARAAQAKANEEDEATAMWNDTSWRQAQVEKILQGQLPPRLSDATYLGGSLSRVLQNPPGAGTNGTSLRELLRLKQVFTGEEPETVTFELPINFDVLTNMGSLQLLVDPAEPEGSDSDNGLEAGMMNCVRAANGDSLLVWKTIFEVPGKHALVARFMFNDPARMLDFLIGPATPFVVTNLCQFSLTSATFDPQLGATLHARLPEPNASYVIEIKAPGGSTLKTIKGATSDGVIKEFWNLMDDHGRRMTNESFDTVFHIALPDSGRSQTLKGP